MVEQKEKKLVDKQIEVDDLIDEAKDFIKKDFEAKKIIMEEEFNKKHLELKEIENNLKERERVLVEREGGVTEREKSLAVRNERGTNSVEGEVGTATDSSPNDILRFIPVAEKDFVAWDKMLAGKMTAMVTIILTIFTAEMKAFISIILLSMTARVTN